ncbi:MAG: TorD/DmsD family molecular chaperone [Thermodesulfobacteriota bacterium]
MKEVLEELMESECRRATLQGLARCFTYPDGAWVESLLSGGWLEAFQEALSYFGLTIDRLVKAVAALPPRNDLALQELQVEYTYLFINALPHVPAPPYASAYRGMGFLMGEPAERAWRAYQAAGLDLAEDFHDLPDHLAVQLEFLSWLEGQEIEAKEQGEVEKAQKFRSTKEKFWAEEVKPWLPEFLTRVEEKARIPFYRELAGLMKIFLDIFPENKN